MEINLGLGMTVKTLTRCTLGTRKIVLFQPKFLVPENVFLLVQACVNFQIFGWKFRSSGLKSQIFTCGRLKTQNFCLRQAETSTFSPAAHWNVKIFACGTLKRQNFPLRHAETSKFPLRHAETSNFSPAAGLNFFFPAVLRVWKF